MNSDQIGSLIRTVMKLISALLAAHGFADTAGLLNAPDVISAVLLIASMIWSHYAHKDSPPSGSGGSPAGGAALLVALVAASLLFTGCTTAYQAEKSADITVTHAMSAWNDYVGQFHPPASQELAVKAAFEKYQQAELMAIDATATGVPDAAMSQSATAALNDLLNLLKTFGVKP